MITTTISCTMNPWSVLGSKTSHGDNNYVTLYKHIDMSLVNDVLKLFILLLGKMPLVI